MAKKKVSKKTRKKKVTKKTRKKIETAVLGVPPYAEYIYIWGPHGIRKVLKASVTYLTGH